METEMRDKKYTEHDIHIAEQLGGIKTLQTTILEKLAGYCDDNQKQHDAMWKKMDSHGKKINWILGIGTGLGVAATATWNWLTKVRG